MALNIQHGNGSRERGGGGSGIQRSPRHHFRILVMFSGFVMGALMLSLLASFIYFAHPQYTISTNPSSYHHSAFRGMPYELQGAKALKLFRADDRNNDADEHEVSEYHRRETPHSPPFM